jgi:AcrR family transcriptional regulator
MIPIVLTPLPPLFRRARMEQTRSGETKGRQAMRDAVTRPRKAQYHHPNLRQALLDQALRMIAERGGPHFSLRELAGEVGATHPSVYRHFADRSALLDALSAAGFERLATYQTQALTLAAPGPLERLVALGIAYVRFAIENPGFFALLFNARPDETPSDSGRDSHSEQVLDTLMTAIRDCQAEGTIIEGDPRRLAGFLIMAPHGYAHYVAQAHQPRVSAENMPIFPEPEALARLDLVPLLVERPSPEEISRLYFAREAATS